MSTNYLSEISSGSEESSSCVDEIYQDVPRTPSVSPNREIIDHDNDDEDEYEDEELESLLDIVPPPKKSKRKSDSSSTKSHKKPKRDNSKNKVIPIF